MKERSRSERLRYGILWPCGVFLLCAVAAGCRHREQSGGLTIAVIPKGTSHVFWRSIHAGAEKAARELGATVIWRGPLREDDRDAQVSEVEGFITRGVSGIVLAPLDESALVGPVADATRSTIQREEGFLEAIGAHRGITVVSANQYGGADVEGAYKKSEALLSGFKRGDGRLDVDGIFTPNESTSLAMLRVLEDNGWAGQVRFVGFDASDILVKGMADAHIDGLVLQDPMNMGYLGVKTIVAHIHGEPVEKRIDTGVRLVKREDMNDPAAKELLHPDLSKWLNR